MADIPIFPRINGKPAVSEDILKDFLAKIQLYSEDDVRWARIPEYPRYGNDLRSPIMTLVTTAIAHMAAESTHTDGSTRSIVETWNVRLAAPGQAASTRWCSPSLSIVATGPSFELPESGPIGYTNIAACIQVVTEENKRCQEQHIFGFAKQMLLQQPNRDAVRLMYMTEDRAALVQFDRAGVQSTREVWYHLEPETFIHFIFAVCAFDEKELGFDDTIRWTFENGKKVAGHIDVINENGVRTSYPMRSVQPIIARSDIYSRGMRIWGVTDPVTGRNLLIKDTWLPSKSATRKRVPRTVFREPSGYMSLSILRGRIDPTFAAGYLRDHLDDLESTFWTLCQTTYAHCDRTSYKLKDAFFQAKAMFDTSKVLNSFGSPTKRVLEEFFLFLKEINGGQLAGDRDNHYKRILGVLRSRPWRWLDAPTRKPLVPMKMNLPSFLKH
ncbi:hypothetical protein FA13DRAFT_1794441 [Coprinellus micaceus]|uniref:Fungal-type protein kinase domain-containing protein n=1 Tax=Coprinellus micaceus TaxID=71717 RepID=A0A4Y7T1C3_COPMI|nr:hypothetical protein FA13DRAFT_1794441 [Coprinellus micaceus]